ncbi:MAG: hypothetical protein OEU36_22300 [Gammaproteobacteria bacterium]|nr:hypothetical protein [Gammaproteobacteria bacterium]
MWRIGTNFSISGACFDEHGREFSPSAKHRGHVIKLSDAMKEISTALAQPMMEHATRWIACGKKIASSWQKLMQYLKRPVNH